MSQKNSFSTKFGHLTTVRHYSKGKKRTKSIGICLCPKRGPRYSKVQSKLNKIQFCNGRTLKSIIDRSTLIHIYTDRKLFFSTLIDYIHYTKPLVLIIQALIENESVLARLFAFLLPSRCRA